MAENLAWRLRDEVPCGWVVISPTEYTGTCNIRVSVIAAESPSDDTACTVTFESVSDTSLTETLIVTRCPYQCACKDYRTVDVLNNEIPASGGTWLYLATLYSEEGCEIDKDDIDVTSSNTDIVREVALNKSNGKITAVIDRNEGKERNFEILVNLNGETCQFQNLKFTQEGAPCGCERVLLNILPTTTIEHTGSIGTFGNVFKLDCDNIDTNSIKVKSTEDWLSVTGNVNTKLVEVKYSANPNTESSPRDAMIYVSIGNTDCNDIVFTVTQEEADECYGKGCNDVNINHINENETIDETGGPVDIAYFINFGDYKNCIEGEISVTCDGLDKDKFKVDYEEGIITAELPDLSCDEVTLTADTMTLPCTGGTVDFADLENECNHESTIVKYNIKVTFTVNNNPCEKGFEISQYSCKECDITLTADTMTLPYTGGIVKFTVIGGD